MEERCVYVGQREVAVAGKEDDVVDMLGSEDATTCHIVILRDTNTGTTGLAHLDTDEPEQFLCLEREVRDRSGVRSVSRELEHRDYQVSILGGYEDEQNTSEDITDTLLNVMQALKATFRLQIAIIGKINTFTKEGLAWPRVYGGGVVLSSGEIFCGKFSYHGPDTDIRALRLSSGAHSLHNIYDSLSGKIIIKPFNYSVLPDAHLWLRRADSFILRYCSTSPLVEPPDFCENIRWETLYGKFYINPSKLITFLLAYYLEADLLNVLYIIFNIF